MLYIRKRNGKEQNTRERPCIVDSKKLNAFLKAARTGSLTRAAEELNYTQSGMTHMMNALEKELGVTLLRRGRNGISLTDSAQQLMPQIEAFIEAADALEAAAAHINGAGAPRLRIGAFTSMAQHWLPGIIQRFLQEEPEADVSVRMEGITGLYTQLREGELDCIFVSRQPTMLAEDAEWLPLHNDELVAIVPVDYPVRGALFDTRRFHRAEFLMPANDFEYDIAPIFSAAGVTPDIRRTNMDDPAILSMVEYGLGISVLSDLVMRERQNKVLKLPLTPPAYRELGIAYRAAGRTGTRIEHFVECSRTCVMELYKA